MTWMRSSVAILPFNLIITFGATIAEWVLWGESYWNKCLGTSVTYQTSGICSPLSGLLGTLKFKSSHGKSSRKHSVPKVTSAHLELEKSQISCLSFCFVNHE